MCLITNIMYNAVVIFKILMIPIESCSLTAISAATLFLTKMAQYLFFTIRMESAVKGTDVAFSTYFIKSVQVFVIVFFGFMAVFRLVVGQFSVYDAERFRCTQSSPLRIIYLSLHALLAVSEIMLSVICVVPYSFKLLKVYKTMQQTGQNSENTNSEILLNVIKKQCKLAFVVIGTSFLIYALLANTITEQGVVQSFGYIDTIINGLCIFCTFDFSLNAFIYRYLFNCNGVSSLQWIFCFCCYCCNERKQKKKTNEHELSNVIESKNVSESTTNENIEIVSVPTTTSGETMNV